MQTREYREKNKERIRQKQKEYRERNKEQLRLYRQEMYKINRDTRLSESKQYRIMNNDKMKEYHRKYREKNRDKLLEAKKKYYQENKDKMLWRSKQYRKENKEGLKVYYKEYIKERRKVDSNFRIAISLRSRLWSALKSQSTSKKNKTVDYIWCTIEELRNHLERQFQPWMTWDNYWKWHIDHIHPISKFNLTEESEIHKAMNWKNLQPLWEDENRKKKNLIL